MAKLEIKYYTKRPLIKFSKKYPNVNSISPKLLLRAINILISSSQCITIIFALKLETFKG